MNQSWCLSEEEIKLINPQNTLNINIGVLGHIDSGKTSLVRALTTVPSTASLDKNPQSQERGITLDLGFSAFYTRSPEGKCNKDYFQFTLVDCPGHASLIKTIIGGAQIIDLMFLVVDVNKGIQTQTAECLVIGEILANKMIVVLNKIDIAQAETLEKQLCNLKKVLAKTKFTENVPIVPISAAQNLHLGKLLDVLVNYVEIPQRDCLKNKGLLLMIDHCFKIKGQGTVVTGTIIQGNIKPGDDIYFPMMNTSKKVKSLQMFKKQVGSGGPGDRIAALFGNLDPQQIERGIICQFGVVQPLDNVLITIQKITYYKGSIKSQQKFHITSGHLTVMGQLRLFVRPKNLQLEINSEGEYLEDFESFEKMKEKYNIYGLVSLEKQLIASVDSLIVASKLDTDPEANVCRIAFHGVILLSYTNNQMQQQNNLRIFRKKQKIGKIEKIIDNYTLIVKDLFKKETKIDCFIGKIIIIKATGNQGKIESSFGKSGKIKVHFEKGIEFNLKPQQNLDETLINGDIVLVYKKYLFHK